MDFNLRFTKSDSTERYWGISPHLDISKTDGETFASITPWCFFFPRRTRIGRLPSIHHYWGYGLLGVDGITFMTRYLFLIERFDTDLTIHLLYTRFTWNGFWKPRQAIIR